MAVHAPEFGRGTRPKVAVSYSPAAALKRRPRRSGSRVTHPRDAGPDEKVCRPPRNRLTPQNGTGFPPNLKRGSHPRRFNPNPIRNELYG